MQTLFEDDVLAVAVQRPEAGAGNGAVLLSFTGVGLAMGGIDVQKPEFLASGQGFDAVVFITDKTRSWGSAVDFDRIRALVRPLAAGRPVHAIGNSMGGFLAILASHHLRLGRVLAFAPQFSVDPAVVPWETRWRKYTAGIARHVPLTAGSAMVGRSRYYVFSGGLGLDRQHAALFPVRDNLVHHVFPDVDHDVAKRLKTAGHLVQTIRACLEGRWRLGFPVPAERLSPAVLPARRGAAFDAARGAC